MKYLLVLLLSLVVHSVHASDAGKPLESASAAYLSKGTEAFIPTLLKGSPLEGEKSVLTQSNSIKQIEAYYGTYKGFEVIYEKQLTDKIRLVYYAMNYADSPMFGVVTYYKRKGEEIVTNFNFNTDLWQIIPNEVVFK